MEIIHDTIKKEPIHENVKMYPYYTLADAADRKARMYYVYHEWDKVIQEYIPQDYDIYVSFNYLKPSFLLPKGKKCIAWIHGDVYDLATEKKLLETVQKELKKDVEIYLNINTPKSIANASESQNQLNIVNELLPKPASDDEINEGIADWVIKYGEITPKDMKAVINHVVAGHPNARKSDIARIVKSNIKK